MKDGAAILKIMSVQNFVMINNDKNCTLFEYELKNSSI